MSPLKITAAFVVGTACGIGIVTLLEKLRPKERYSMQVVQNVGTVVYRLDAKTGKIEVFAVDPSDKQIKTRTIAEAVNP